MHALLTIRNSDLRYPLCYCWETRLSGLLHHMFGLFVPEVSKNHTAFILRAVNQLRTYNLKIKALVAFETSGMNYQATGHNNPEDLLPQYENGFAKSKISQCCVFTSGWSGNLAATARCMFRYGILSLSLVTQATSLTAVHRALLTFKWALWRTLHTVFCRSLSRVSSTKVSGEYPFAVAF